MKFAEIRGQDCGVVRFAKERDAELAISKQTTKSNQNGSILNKKFLFSLFQNLKTDHASMVAKLKFHSFKHTNTHSLSHLKPLNLNKL